ncbi:MAG: 3-oxoacyl-ACP reductase FabG [Oscillospiraceae bacterium]|nr:3-oxoacyl-ACP reductase FabG [Oscillospiraceae bacterium]
MTVIVTGASRGIGLSIAESFARRGDRVFATYKNTTHTLPALSESLQKDGFSLTPVFCDVTSEASIKELFEVAGGCDILINNAGIADFNLLSDITEKLWDKIFDTNLKSAFLASREASRYMIAKKWGRIINISSVWGVVGASCEAHYSASKAGLIGFTRALAKELGPSGITVNCIAPGVIETDMNEHLSPADMAALCEETPLGRIGKPSDISHAALFLAEADFITGETLSVGGGFGM